MVLWWNKFIPQAVYFGHTNKKIKIKMYFCFWRVTKWTHRENERETERDRERQTETERQRQREQSWYIIQEHKNEKKC